MKTPTLNPEIARLILEPTPELAMIDRKAQTLAHEIVAAWVEIENASLRDVRSTLIWFGAACIFIGSMITIGFVVAVRLVSLLFDGIHYLTAHPQLAATLFTYALILTIIRITLLLILLRVRRNEIVLLVLKAELFGSLLAEYLVDEWKRTTPRKFIFFVDVDKNFDL